MRNGNGMIGFFEKIEKCNLTEDQRSKLKIAKFDFWFIHKLRMNGGFEYFTQNDYNANFRQETFHRTDYWSNMFIPTSWFDVIGKSMEQVIEEVELAENEDEDIQNAMISFETCHGVTRVSWLRFINEEELEHTKTNDLKITKFIKRLLLCDNLDV